MRSARKWYLVLGGLMVGAILAVAFLAPHLTSLSPYHTDIRVVWPRPKLPYPPGGVHPLGTDEFGRDIWSRIAYGARWSLLFAFLIMSARLIIAVPMAFLGAYGPRLFDWVLKRFYVFTTAFPPLLIYLFILSVPRLRLIGFWPSTFLTVALLTVAEWARIAMPLKGRLEELNHEPFLEGAIAVGAGRVRLFTVHLLPHLWPTLLRLTAEEMARGLLVIAQLGLFGIWVGGGVLERISPTLESTREVMATGIPEWGTMLASARQFITTAPWIPLAPAGAFFVGVVGFNLLSLGMESIPLSLGRWKEKTTGRLSARWRWALVPLVAMVLLWFYQGLPWSREAGVATLAERQAGRLSAADLDGYLATLTAGDTEYISDQKTWATRALQTPYDSFTVKFSDLSLTGSRGTATWNIVLHHPDGSTTTSTWRVGLQRRWGTWYVGREEYTDFQTRHVNLAAVYDPNSAEPTLVVGRMELRRLAAVADMAYERVAALFTADSTTFPEAKPPIRVYPTVDAYQMAVPTAGTTSHPNLTTFVMGEAIRVSPSLMWEAEPDDIQPPLEQELLKFMTRQQLGRETAHPVLTGIYELGNTTADMWVVRFWDWSGAKFYSLPELFTTNLNDLTWDRMAVYKAQSAFLVELLREKIPEAELMANLEQYDTLAKAAGALAMTPEQLESAYQAHVHERLTALSKLDQPAWRKNYSPELVSAVENYQAELEAATGIRAKALELLIRQEDVWNRYGNKTVKLSARIFTFEERTGANGYEAVIATYSWSADEEGNWNLQLADGSLNQ